jgi:sialic acid synthase SpsE
VTEQPGAPFRSSFAIGGRLVGSGQPVYLIAEAGANHNRDLGIATQLIDAAADAGVDAVKFQLYTGEAVYSAKAPRLKYFPDKRSPRELLDAIALPREWLSPLAARARDRGLAFFASPFDVSAVEALATLGVPAMKIASFELVDIPLIRRAAAVGVPVILSTGMATHSEIDDALSAVSESGNQEVALLRCASLYPAPARLMNLRAMESMRSAFAVPVGLSDHSAGLAIPAAAVGLGAELLEKHFTLSRAMDGPDHRFALEPEELRAMVEGVREVEAALGSGHLDGPSPEEAEEMYGLRRSVVAAVDIPVGVLITRQMVTTKRPGHGIKPKHIDRIVGRRARVDIEADEVLTWDMV